MMLGCFMFFAKSAGLSFLNSVHSVIMMQQSAFLRQLCGEVAYWILFWKIVLAVGMAAGS